MVSHHDLLWMTLLSLGSLRVALMGVMGLKQLVGALLIVSGNRHICGWSDHFLSRNMERFNLLLGWVLVLIVNRMRNVQGAGFLLVDLALRSHV